MKSLSKSEKFLIGLLLAVIVSYVYYQYIIIPITTKTQAAQSRVENYQQQLLQARLMEASNKKMSDEIGTLKEKYEEYMKLMPKSDMNIEVMRELNKNAVNNKVTLIGITLGNGVEYKSSEESANNSSSNNNSASAAGQQKNEVPAFAKIMAVPVTISIKGDYSNFMAYINNLENSGRIVNISSVNVTKPGNTASDSQLSVTLNANVLYVQDGTPNVNKYDFNDGNYSKANPYK